MPIFKWVDEKPVWIASSGNSYTTINGEISIPEEYGADCYEAKTCGLFQAPTSSVGTSESG